MKLGEMLSGSRRGCGGGLGNLCLVFLVPVMFVSADVVHQVALFILVFVAVFSVLQEVEGLQNVAGAPVQMTNK